MSAIFGYVAFDGRPVTADVLRRPMDAAVDYGTDAVGTWTGDAVALGHRARHFTPESLGETLPFESEGLAITCDARIDNRDELMRLLDVRDKAVPDSRIILAAFQKWDTQCTERLLGDFAFAIWNRRSRILFCGRDHAGARSFYYHHSGRAFAFASSIEGVLAFPDVSPDIDELEVAAYLYNPLNVAIRTTFFKQVSKLPFGYQFHVSADGIREHRHWEPWRQPAIRLKRIEDYGELVRECVSAAVACRIRTPFKASAHLSGGLDSSSIAVIAARQLRAQGRELAMAFSWSPPRSAEYPQAKNDERDVIARLCASEGIRCHFPSITDDDQYAFHRRDISLVPGAVRGIEMGILRAAAASNIRTILSGWGGDEGITFNGRGYLLWLLMTGHWMKFMRLLGAWSRWRPKRSARILFWHAVIPLMPLPIFWRFMPVSPINMPPSLAAAGFAARTRLQRRNGFAEEPRERTGPFRTQAALFNHGHLTQRMEAWTIWGAPHGVTYSYPLLDRRVLECAYALPHHLLFQGRRDRVPYREAMLGTLPDEIRNNPSKDDPVFEECSRRLSKALLLRLQQNAQAGEFDDAGPWLDLPRLKQALQTVPDPFRNEDYLQFIRITDAVYMLDLWKRHGASP